MSDVKTDKTPSQVEAAARREALTANLTGPQLMMAAFNAVVGREGVALDRSSETIKSDAAYGCYSIKGVPGRFKISVEAAPYTPRKNAKNP